ncbi:MAG TPA: hypothetical protein DDW52_17515 [Planctomycetaceae bacterium]|nr:hypothetical protein [Planctomycetaceae bacterium]
MIAVYMRSANGAPIAPSGDPNAASGSTPRGISRSCELSWAPKSCDSDYGTVAGLATIRAMEVCESPENRGVATYCSKRNMLQHESLQVD